jgi:hypothetical protein
MMSNHSGSTGQTQHGMRTYHLFIKRYPLLVRLWLTLDVLYIFPWASSTGIQGKSVPRTRELPVPGTRIGEQDIESCKHLVDEPIWALLIMNLIRRRGFRLSKDHMMEQCHRAIQIFLSAATGISPGQFS